MNLQDTSVWLKEHVRHQRRRIREESVGDPDEVMFRWRCACGAVHTGIGQHEYDFRRASGECICEACCLPYFDHPHSFHGAWASDEAYMHRLCDGSLVHL